MGNRAILWAFVCVVSGASTGCVSQPQLPESDGGVSADGFAGDSGGDAFAGGDTGLDAALDAGADGGVDGGMAMDVGPTDAGPITTSVEAPPAEVVRMGSGGLLLRGTVLAPTGPITPGEVLIVGNTIACVAADCSATAGASTATIIDTHATISPGLIDGHNHLTYDFLPEWVPPHLYMNRYEWSNDASYMAFIAPYADHRSAGDYVCPSTKWGELRSIVHGTTTVQGQSPEQSCADRLARNADHFHGLGTDHMQTAIGSVRDLTDAMRTTIIGNFTAGTTTRFVVHMEEGYAGMNVDRELASYAGRDTRTVSLFESMGMPYRTGVFIHSVGLTTAELDETAMEGASIVWSPSSNMVLYGRTADIASILARDIVVGIGPDWTPSGSDEMLSELRYAQQYGHDNAVTALTSERLWRMATSDGAEVVGLASGIGSLTVGLRADISVFGRTSADPYQAVIDSRARDVRLVLIDGAAYYGDASLQAATAVNTSCEAFDACGTAKFLCAANTPGSASRATETVADIHEQLRVIMASYMRESELLELVDCSL
jgi:cytosine/adenosine deaminase-related metal-dependent hydrolase